MVRIGDPWLREILLEGGEDDQPRGGLTSWESEQQRQGSHTEPSPPVATARGLTGTVTEVSNIQNLNTREVDGHYDHLDFMDIGP